MQLGRHNREVQAAAVRIVFNHIQLPELAGHVWLDWRLLWHTNMAVDSQYAGVQDLWLIASGDKNYLGAPRLQRTVSAWAWRDWGNYDVGWR